MTYKSWIANLSLTTTPEIQAQLWNLKNETRLGQALTRFRRQIGKLQSGKEKSGTPGPKAATDVLTQVVHELSHPTCKWLGLIPFADSTPAAAPPEMVSHLPIRDIHRYAASGPIDERNPPRAIRFSKPLKSPYTFPHSKFIWLTFEPAGGSQPTDPTLVVRELGLAHYPPATFLYRMTFVVKGLQLYVPSCLDAGLYAAWAPPQVATSWGLTRNLETGSSGKPELLTISANHATFLPLAEVVSPPGSLVRTGPVSVDYMTGRK